MEAVTSFIFLGSKITADGDCSHEIKRRLLLGRKAMMNLDNMLKSGDITLLTSFHIVKAIVFPLVMYGCWELDYKEGWTSKNWCFLTMVLEKTLESPLDSKAIKPINCKGNQPSIFIGRTDAKIEAPIFWPPDAKSQHIGKDGDAGKDWGQGEGDDRGWDAWMASPTQCTCCCCCSAAQSCPTLCDPMTSPSGSSVHGNSPGKNTGMGCHALLQGIFLTQGLNPGLPHCRQILYHLSHQGHEFNQTPGNSEEQGKLSMGLWRVRNDWMTEQKQQN